MKKIINKIEKFGDTLSPNAETQDNIWSLVSSKLTPEKNVRNNFRMIWFMKNSIKYSMIVFVVCFVISVPVYFMTNVKNQNVSPLQSDSIVMSESSTTAEDENVMGAPSKEWSPKASYSMEGREESLVDKAISAINPQRSNAVDNDTKESARAKDVDANLVYNVVDVWKSVDSVYSIIAEYDGYTTNVTTSTTGAHFVIKVPIEKFDAMHQKLRGLASSVDSESIYSVDKQNEISSINTSIKSHEEKVAELKDALSKATTQAEKDSIQKQITAEESLLKSSKDNLSTLTKVTDVATVNLELKQDSNATTTDLMSSLQDTWNMIKGVGITWLRIVLLAVVFIIAVSPVAVPLYLLAKSRRNKKLQEKTDHSK